MPSFFFFFCFHPSIVKGGTCIIFVADDMAFRLSPCSRGHILPVRQGIDAGCMQDDIRISPSQIDSGIKPAFAVFTPPTSEAFRITPTRISTVVFYTSTEIIMA